MTFTPDRNQSTQQMQSAPIIRHSMVSSQSPGNRAVVAFGSNMGNRLAHIENAISRLEDAGIEILALSRLYESKPMYYEKQERFLNGVVLIQTDLSAMELLDTLQRIESEQGRVRDISNGPRTLDLDIILFNHDQINEERLKVPHPLMMERVFVLRPLHDVLHTDERIPPSPLLPQDSTNWTTLNKALTRLIKPADAVFARTCLSDKQPLLSRDDPHRKTRIMSIMNITPDSFSDGGKLFPDDTSSLIATAKVHIAAGAQILDIGGQSTRPNSTLISAEEELSRVLPALLAIRNIPEIRDGRVAVSLDTFDSSVAECCLKENLVDIINDISAGNMDKNMLATVAKYNKTIILMHMRGTPQTMTEKRYHNYSELGGVVGGVASELAESVNRALEAGIKPWRIILDPGIGFAKAMKQNMTLLDAGTRRLVLKQPLHLGGLPWLIGTSRKGFIGKVTGVEQANERIWGTAACVTAAIAGGADIVRVHDVAEMAMVAKMADAIHR